MALSYLSSAFPFHLHTGKITARRKRISYARLCVEVDASTELVKEFDPRCDNGEWITIKAELEYEMYYLWGLWALYCKMW